MAQQDSFDLQTHLNSFRLPPEEKNAFEAQDIGMDPQNYVEQPPAEIHAEYEKQNNERFTNRILDTYEEKPDDDFYKLMMDNPAVVKWPVHKKESAAFAHEVRPWSLHTGKSYPVKRSPDMEKAVEVGLQSQVTSLKTINSLFLNPNDEKVLKRLAASFKKEQEIRAQYSPEFKEYQKAVEAEAMTGDIFGTIGKAFSSPRNYGVQVSESMTQFAPTMIGTIGAGMLAGPIGGTVASIGMGGAQNYLMYFQEWFEKNDYDVTNPDHLRAVFQNPDEFQRLKNAMKTKAGTQAIIEGAITLTLNKFIPGLGTALSKYKIGKKGRKAITAGALVLGEAVGEGAGEFAGQVQAEGKFSMEALGQAYMEGIFSIGQSGTRALFGHDLEGRKTHLDTLIERNRRLGEKGAIEEGDKKTDTDGAEPKLTPQEKALNEEMARLEQEPFEVVEQKFQEEVVNIMEAIQSDYYHTVQKENQWTDDELRKIVGDVLNTEISKEDFEYFRERQKRIEEIYKRKKAEQKTDTETKTETITEEDKEEIHPEFKRTPPEEEPPPPEPAPGAIEQTEQEKLIKEAEGDVINFHNNRGGGRIRKYISDILNKKLLHKIKAWNKIPEHIFKMLDGHLKDREGFFTKTFRDIEHGSNLAAEEVNQTRKKVEKLNKESGIFTDENKGKKWKSKIPGFPGTIDGIGKLLFFIFNGGNSSNISNTLDRPISTPGVMRSPTLRSVINEDLTKNIGSRKSVNKKLSNIVNGVASGLMSVPEAINRLALFYNQMKGNIYKHPDFKQFMAAVNFMESHDATTFNESILADIADPLMYGYFLNSLDIDPKIFSYADSIFELFNEIGVRENDELKKIGEQRGTIQPDLDNKISPFFKKGGYFPIRYDNSEEVGLAGAEKWTRGPHVKRRGEGKAERIPSDIHLNNIILPSLNRMIRNIHLAVPYTQAQKTIGPEASIGALRGYLQENLPDVANIIDAWLGRVNRGKIIKENDLFTRIMKKLTNRGKLVKMFLNPVVSIEQLAGVAIKYDIRPGTMMRQAMRLLSGERRQIKDQAMSESSFMRNYETNRQFALFDETGREVFPTRTDNPELKKIIDKAKELDAKWPGIGYATLGYVQSQVNLIIYTSKRDDVFEATGNMALAIREGESAVRLTQGSFAYQNVASAQATSITHLVPFFNYFLNRANYNLTILDEIKRDKKLDVPAKSMKIFYLLALTPAIEVLTRSIWDTWVVPKGEDEEKFWKNFLYNFLDWWVAVGGNMLAGPVGQEGLSTFFQYRAHPDWGGEDFMKNSNIIGLDFMKGLFVAVDQTFPEGYEKKGLFAKPKKLKTKKNIWEAKDSGLSYYEMKSLSETMSFVFPPSYRMYKTWEYWTRDRSKDKRKKEVFK